MTFDFRELAAVASETPSFPFSSIDETSFMTIAAENGEANDFEAELACIIAEVSLHDREPDSVFGDGGPNPVGDELRPAVLKDGTEAGRSTDDLEI